MKKNKTLTIKTILRLAAGAILAATLFLACSNLEDEAASAFVLPAGGPNAAGGQAAGADGPNAAGGQGGAQAPAMVTVNGSLAFGGAYPEQIAALVENSGSDGLDGIARSAFPDAASSGLTYSVYALEDLPAGSTDTPLRYEGTVAADNSSYTVGIPVLTGKKYNVFAEVKNGGITVLSGQSAKVIEAPSGESSFVTDANITLAATQTATGTGLVALVVADPDQKAVSACVCYKVGSTDYEKNLTKSGSGTDTVWTLEIGEIKTNAGGENYIDGGLKSGAHLMTFEFYSDVDASGTLLYSFTEAVNVFDVMTTNKWGKNGAEPWLTPDSSGNIACKITAAMVTGFTLTDIYVDTSAADDTGSGSFMHPKKTFASAVGMLLNENADYTIHINGTVAETATSTVAHRIPSSISAKSLTICGVNPPDGDGVPTDALSGGGSRETLYIAKTVPVTIKNLKITGGKAEKGGGIRADIYNCVLTLAEGAYITGNEATDYTTGGGGVYFDGAELIMLDGAVIADNEASGSGSGSKGCGGGVYLCSGKKFTMYGGVIKDNSAVGNGGGVYMTKGAFTMTGGVIGDDTKDTPANSNSGKYSNKASKGAGVYIYGVVDYESQTKADLLGGTIAYNYATVNGGGVYAAHCRSVTIKNTVKCNGAVCGGGVYTFASVNCNTYVYLDGCSILKNKAYPTDASKDGGGALVVGNSATKYTCSVTLKGAASIPCTRKYENDIQLGTTASNSAILTVNGKLTAAGIIGTITPLSYTEAHAVLDGSTSEYYKFAVTPQTSPAQEWKVGADGKMLKATVLTKATIGGFTFDSIVSNQKYHFVIGSDVYDSQFSSFMGQLCHSSANKISENSTLDLSKATSLNGLTWPTISTGSWLQKFDTVIIGPNFSTNWYNNANVHYVFLKVKNIVAPSNCVNYSSDNGILFNKDKTKIVFYPGGSVREETSYTIPSSVTEIAPYTFYWATGDTTGLMTIRIHANVKKIGRSAFPMLDRFASSGTLNFVDKSGWHQNSTSDAPINASDLTAANYNANLANITLVKE